MYNINKDVSVWQFQMVITAITIDLGIITLLCPIGAHSSTHINFSKNINLNLPLWLQKNVLVTTLYTNIATRPNISKAQWKTNRLQYQSKEYYAAR